MTNKEAITYLDWLSNIDFSKKHPTYTMVTNPDQVEALKLAITALQVQEVAKDTNVLNNDTISRRQAIDAFEDTTFTKKEIFRRLSELPPVQPEPERTMEEFMYGQDMGNPEDGSL